MKVSSSFVCYIGGLFSLTPGGWSFMLSQEMRQATSLVGRTNVNRFSSSFGVVINNSFLRHTMSADSCSEVNAEACEVVSEEGTTTFLTGPELPPIPSTAKRLFLVRHGEVINPGGDRPVFYGALDVPLSPLGELEAKAAGQYLSQINLQHVAASPLSRAIFGANQVLTQQQQNNKELIVLEGFTELDRGAWCGQTKEEIGADLMDRFDACDLTVTPEGGESYPDLKQRVLAARDQLLQQTDTGKASAVVSHLQVTRSILSEAMGIPTDKMVNLKVATASVSCIDFYDDATGTQIVHFQSFKPDVGLQKSKDGAN